MVENPGDTQTKIWHKIISVEWLILVVGICIGLLLPVLIQQLQSNDVINFFENLIPEAIGIGFTVAILDRLNGYRESRLIREQLVRRAHSRHNQTALAAIEELRILGQLEKGALAGRELRGSNWCDANLYKADLRGSDLTNAELYRADLVEADLTNTTVSDEQLASCDIMHKAIMPNGKRYDGRYKLTGDYVYAKSKNIDISDPEAMAIWYEVSFAEFLEGEAWANQHLEHYLYRSLDYDLSDKNNQIYN